MTDVLRNGLVGNGSAEDGALKVLIEKAEPGATIYFPATLKGYSFLDPIIIKKSLTIKGDGIATVIQSWGQQDSLFKIIPDSYDEKITVHFEDFKMVGGYRGFDFSGSVHPSGAVSGSSGVCSQSSIRNVFIEDFEEIGIKISQDQAELFIKDVRISSSLYGFFGSSWANYNQLYFENSLIEGTFWGIYFSGASNSSGAIAFNNISQVNNNTGFVFENIVYTVQSPTYINTPYQITNSGSTQASSLPAHAATHQSGGLDQIVFVSLSSQGVPQGALAISNGDGTWTTLLTSSLTADTSVTPAQFNPFSASMKEHSASVNIHSSSMLEVTASYYASSASFSSVSSSFAHSSASFAQARGDLDSHVLDTGNPHATSLENLDPGDLADLNAIINDATLDDSSNPRPPLAHSASHYSGSSDALNAHQLAAFGLGPDRFLITNNAGGITSITSASLVDPLYQTSGALASGQNILFNASGTFALNQNLLISSSGTFAAQIGTANTNITILTNASGVFEAHRTNTSNPHNTSIANLGGGTLSQLNTAVSDATLDDSSNPRPPLAHSASHYSGSLDPLSLQHLAGFGLAPDLVLVSDGLGGWKTVTSQSVGGTGGGGGPHASTHLSGASDALNAHQLGASGLDPNRFLITNNDGGLTTITSSSLVDPLYQASGTFASNISDLNVRDAVLTAASASFLSGLNILTDASGTFASDINSVENSVVVLTNASASFLSNLNNLNVRDSVLTAASASFVSDINTLTNASASFASNINSTAANVVILTSASASFVSSINILTNASGVFESHRTNTSNPHGTSIANLGGGTLAQLNSAISDATIDDSSASRTPTAHSASHYSGSSDPLSLQHLAGFGLAEDLLLVSDGLGGWKTVTLEELEAALGIGPHAATHLSGASDALNAHQLGASGLAVNRFLITNDDGGLTSIASSSLVDPLYQASGTFATDINSTNTNITILTSASASFLSEINSLNTRDSVLTAASASFVSDINLLIGASGTFASDINSVENSVVILTAASTSFNSDLANLNTRDAVLTSASASFVLDLGILTNASGVFETHRTNTSNPHGTSIANIGAGTLSQLNSAVSDATLDDSSSARTPLPHSSSHYSGSLDPLSLQHLAGFGLAPDLVLVSDGLGGWKTVTSQSVGGSGGGGPVAGDPVSFHSVEGFTSSDYYRSAAEELPGGSHMLAVWYGYIGNPGAGQFLIGNSNASGHGWAIWKTGASSDRWFINVSVHDGVGAPAITIASDEDFSAQDLYEPVHIAVYKSGTYLAGYINGGISRFSPSTVSAGHTPGSGVRFTVGFDPSAWSEPLLNGAFAGAAYTTGSVSVNDIREHYIACRAASRMVEGDISWSNLYDLREPGGSFPTQIDDLINSAHLERVGAAITAKREDVLVQSQPPATYISSSAVDELFDASGSFANSQYPSIITYTGTAMTMSNADHGSIFRMTADNPIVWIDSGLKPGTTAEFQRKGLSLTITGSGIEMEYDTGSFAYPPTVAGINSSIVVTVFTATTSSIKGDFTIL